MNILVINGMFYTKQNGWWIREMFFFSVLQWQNVWVDSIPNSVNKFIAENDHISNT